MGAPEGGFPHLPRGGTHLRSPVGGTLASLRALALRYSPGSCNGPSSRSARSPPGSRSRRARSAPTRSRRGSRPICSPSSRPARATRCTTRSASSRRRGPWRARPHRRRGRAGSSSPGRCSSPAACTRSRSPASALSARSRRSAASRSSRGGSPSPSRRSAADGAERRARGLRGTLRAPCPRQHPELGRCASSPRGARALLLLRHHVRARPLRERAPALLRARREGAFSLLSRRSGARGRARARRRGCGRVEAVRHRARRRSARRRGRAGAGAGVPLDLAGGERRGGARPGAPRRLRPARRVRGPRGRSRARARRAALGARALRAPRAGGPEPARLPARRRPRALAARHGTPGAALARSRARRAPGRGGRGGEGGPPHRRGVRGGDALLGAPRAEGLGVGVPGAPDGSGARGPAALPGAAAGAEPAPRGRARAVPRRGGVPRPRAARARPLSAREDERRHVRHGPLVRRSRDRPKHHRLGPRAARAWQLPQYLLLGAGDVLVSVTGLELSSTHAPPAMRSTVSSIWFLTASGGNLLTALVTRLVRLEGAAWFWFFAAVMLAAALVFRAIARGWRLAPTEAIVAE